MKPTKTEKEKILELIDNMIKKEWEDRDSSNSEMMIKYHQTRLNLLGVELKKKIEEI